MASIVANILEEERAAPVGNYALMVRKDWTAEDFLYLLLNETLEYKLSEILRFNRSVAPAILKWARTMAETIPGYDNWDQIARFTRDSLTSKREIADDPRSEIVGNETDLHAKLNASERGKYGPLDESVGSPESAAALAQARTRIATLDEFRNRVTKSASMARPLALLFRKIYYTYKLREALLGQVGYYNGSLELRVGLTSDFEYWMYLIQMKLRRPDRQRLYRAPKSMLYYSTPAETLLPWNNQFSFSYGFNEFGIDQMPRRSISFIERRLVELVRSEQSWRTLCKLLEWDADSLELNAERERILTQFTIVREGGSPAFFVPNNLILANLGFERIRLDRIVGAIIDDEVKLKALFTLVMRLTWSDEPLHAEHNPFHHLYESGTLEERTAAAIALAGEGIKDPRLSDRAPSGPEILAQAKQLFNVIGRKANVLLEPRSAAPAFRAKLEKLHPQEFEDLYDNVPREHRSLHKVVDQAVFAAERWRDQVLLHRKPIYTGPSGHALTYINLYLTGLDGRSPGAIGGPNLTECQLVLLAGLVGFNQHHSYDEVMTAAAGITYGGETLRYSDRTGYRDLLDLPGTIGGTIGRLLRLAIEEIATTTIQAYRNEGLALADPTDVVRGWFQNVTGESYRKKSNL